MISTPVWRQAAGERSGRAETTQRDEKARGEVIADEFEEFRARDIEPPDVVGAR
jgi:hypothetical protein